MTAVATTAETSRRHISPMLATGLIMTALLLLAAVFAPILLADSANTLTDARRQGPSAEHWLGTDEFGRDLFSRALVATRLTLILATVATAIAVISGVVIGLLVWMAPERVRYVVLGANNMAVAFPALVMALVIAAILGPGAFSATIAVGVAGIPAFVRLTANMAAPIMTRDYVSTSKRFGVRRPIILFRHVFPNLGEPLLVLAANSYAVTLTELSGLSFLGLGVQNPDYDFGRLLAEALPNVYTQPAHVLGPSAMLVLTGCAVMFIGDGLAARSNPRTRRAVRGRNTGGLRRASETSPYRSEATEAVLSVRNLKVISAAGEELVCDVNLQVAPGEVVGLVGESGSGKSLTAMSAAGLVPEGVTATVEELTAVGHDLLDRPGQSQLAQDVALIYQEPMSSFNPALNLGSQLTEVPRVHLRKSRSRARQELVDKFTQLRISKPGQRVRQHPHELSGGMLQRAMISSALVTEAKLFIADEPTTALDVTVQAEVLREFVSAAETLDAGVLFISHDLGVVEHLCDRVLVMRHGEVIEELSREQLAAEDVHHPYTQTLLEAARFTDVDHAQRASASGKSGEGA